MPAYENIKKDDSNYGIDSEWVKVFIHNQKGNQLANLPRCIWVNKQWTLKDLHLNFFDFIKNVIVRWYKDVKERGKSDKSNHNPQYTHPDSGELLTYDTFVNLPIEL